MRYPLDNPVGLLYVALVTQKTAMHNRTPRGSTLPVSGHSASHAKGGALSLGGNMNTLPHLDWAIALSWMKHFEERSQHSPCTVVRYRTRAVSKSMKARCRSYAKRRWRRTYFLKGIAYCDRWEHHCGFRADMGFRPSPDHVLHRLDHSGQYEPGNVTWVRRRQHNALHLNRRKLSEAQALTILRYAQDPSRKRGWRTKLARAYGVSLNTVSTIALHKAWKHITLEDTPND